MNDTSRQTCHVESRQPGRRALGLTVAVMALFWLGLLPWIGRQPDVAARIRREQCAGIDPAAMFFTELELLPAIVHRYERLDALHSPSFRLAGQTDPESER
jgi:hypothetical protein